MTELPQLTGGLGSFTIQSTTLSYTTNQQRLVLNLVIWWKNMVPIWLMDDFRHTVWMAPMTRKYGVSSTGLIAPIIREGDNLVETVTDTVLNSGLTIEDGDVLGIAESVVARAEGNYVNIDEGTPIVYIK